MMDMSRKETDDLSNLERQRFDNHYGRQCFSPLLEHPFAAHNLKKEKKSIELRSEKSWYTTERIQGGMHFLQKPLWSCVSDIPSQVLYNVKYNEDPRTHEERCLIYWKQSSSCCGWSE
mmetsp:Transcript_20840/g.32070  ORF Transcript_20840/g.32070 Transcript_20840/m.32070 type:complete len:118 (-) Transcript_20840:247-600(-)